MSDQFFYVQLKFTPKIGADREPTKQHEAVVEVPKDLVQRNRSGSSTEKPREKVIVLDLARRAALGTFPTVPERALGLYDEEQPIWYEDRPRHERAAVRGLEMMYETSHFCAGLTLRIVGLRHAALPYGKPTCDPIESRR